MSREYARKRLELELESWAQRSFDEAVGSEESSENNHIVKQMDGFVAGWMGYAAHNQYFRCARAADSQRPCIDLLSLDFAFVPPTVIVVYAPKTYRQPTKNILEGGDVDTKDLLVVSELEEGISTSWPTWLLALSRRCGETDFYSN